MGNKYINMATMFLMFASFFIFAGMVLAQADVYVGDEDLDVGSGEVQIQQETTEPMDNEVPVDSRVNDIQVKEVPPAANTTVTKTINTAPEEAPDAGPKETLLIVVSVLIGLAFATFFLFKKVKEYNN